jgi:hypothetical protein
MTTVDRINALLDRLDLPRIGIPDFSARQAPLHYHLNRIDSAIGADTEWLSSLECQCLWHIGKACHARRAVGARVRMLEEIVALNDLRSQFAV